VFRADRGTDPKTDRTHHQIVGDPRNIFLPCFVRFLTCQRRSNRVLGKHRHACRKHHPERKQRRFYKLITMERGSTMTHRQVHQVLVKQLWYQSPFSNPNPVTCAYLRPSPFKIVVSFISWISFLRENDRLRQAKFAATFY